MTGPWITATANEKCNKETSAGSTPWEGREGVVGGGGGSVNQTLTKGENDYHKNAHSLMFSGFSSPVSKLNSCKGLLSLRKFYSLALLSRRTFIRFYCTLILVPVSWVSVLSALVARQWENLTIYWLCIDKFLPFPTGQLTMLLQQVVLGFLNKKKMAIASLNLVSKDLL